MTTSNSKPQTRKLEPETLDRIVTAASCDVAVDGGTGLPCHKLRPSDGCCAVLHAQVRLTRPDRNAAAAEHALACDNSLHDEQPTLNCDGHCLLDGLTCMGLSA